MADISTITFNGTVYNIKDDTARAAVAGTHGVPTGGTQGQVLAKLSGTNYDVAWVNQSGGGGGSTADAATIEETLSYLGIT